MRAGFNDQMLAFQISAATTYRGARLPSLGTVRYMFQNTRGMKYDPAAVKELFVSLARAQNTGRFWGDMKMTIERSLKGWNLDLGPDPEVGKKFFRQLQSALRTEAQDYDKLEAVLTALEYSEYIPRKNLLFVKLPNELRGLFSGRGGERKMQFEAQIGCKIQWEQLQG